MPDVELLFRIREDGSVDAVTRRMEQGLQRVQRTAADTTRAVSSVGGASAYWGSAGDQIDAYVKSQERARASTDVVSKAHERAAVSTRAMNQAIGAMSVAFGGASPVLTTAALSAANFGQDLAGVSTKAKLAAGGVVALGTVISALVYRSQELDQISTRFAAIDRSVRAVDVGALRGGMAELTVELDAYIRRTGTFMGSRMESLADNVRVAMGLPTGARQLTDRQDALRAGLTQVLPLESAASKAAHRGEMIESSAQWMQQYVGGKLATGEVGADAVRRQAERMRGAIAEALAVAEQAIEAQRKLAFAEAGARGTLDIESGAIVERFGQARESLRARADLKRLGIDEWERAQGATVAGRDEALRAAMAQGAIARQEAMLGSIRSQIPGEVAANAARVGWKSAEGLSIGRRDVTSYAEQQAIEAEKALTLAMIEEATAKQIDAIHRMQATELDKERLVADARRTAELQRQSALDEAQAKEDELVRTIETRLRDAMAQVGPQVRANLVDPIDEAKRKMDELAQGMSATSADPYQDARKAAAGTMGGVGWKAWTIGENSPIYDRNLLAEFGSLATPALRAAFNQASTWDRNTILDQLRSALNEQTNNWLVRQRQTEVLNPYGTTVEPGLTVSSTTGDVGGGGGGDLVVNLNVDGHRLVGSIKAPLADALRTGDVQVVAR